MGHAAGKNVTRRDFHLDRREEVPPLPHITRCLFFGGWEKSETDSSGRYGRVELG